MKTAPLIFKTFQRARPNLFCWPLPTNRDLLATARELRNLLSARTDAPVKVVPPADNGFLTAMRLMPNKVVIEAHALCRPVMPQGIDLWQ